MRTLSSASGRASAGSNRGHLRQRRATTPLVRLGLSTTSSSGGDNSITGLPPIDESSVGKLSIDQLLRVICAEIQRSTATHGAGVDSTPPSHPLLFLGLRPLCLLAQVRTFTCLLL